MLEGAEAVESALRAVWAEALGRSSIPGDVSVFDLGADQELLRTVISRIAQVTGAYIPGWEMARNPTARGQARLIVERRLI